MHHKLLFPILLLSLLLLCSCSSRLSEDELNAQAELVAEEKGISEAEARNTLGEASYISLSIIGIKYNSCTETDKGADYTTKGEAALTYSYLGNQRSTVKSDFCIKNTLIEYFCINEKRFAKRKYQCQGNCADGACI